MMKMVPKFMFYLFQILFLVFVWNMLNFWNDAILSLHDGTAIARGMYIANAFLSSYLLFIVVLVRRHFYGIHIITILWIVFMPFVIYFNHGRGSDYFATILWPLLFEVTCFFCSYNKKYFFSLQKLFYLIALYGAYLFIRTRLVGNVGGNTVYFSLLTLPWLLCLKKKTMRLILLFIFTFMVLFSAKRSSMIVIGMAWLFYLLEFLKNKKKRLYAIVIVFSLFFVVTVGVEYVNVKTQGKLIEKINKDETSEELGRLVIWKNTINMISESSSDGIALGHGHHAVFKQSIFHMSAHNDFLEVIYDYGIIIFILYLGLWIHVTRRCFYLYKIKSDMFLPYSVSFAIFLSLSMVSHLILYTSYFNFLVMFWAAVEAVLPRKKLTRKEVSKMVKYQAEKERLYCNKVIALYH